MLCLFCCFPITLSFFNSDQFHNEGIYQWEKIIWYPILPNRWKRSCKFSVFHMFFTCFLRFFIHWIDASRANLFHIVINLVCTICVIIHNLHKMYSLILGSWFFSEFVLNVLWCNDCVLFGAAPNKIGPVFIGTFKYYSDTNNNELQCGYSYL